MERINNTFGLALSCLCICIAIVFIRGMFSILIEIDRTDDAIEKRSVKTSCYSLEYKIGENLYKKY
jgi:hypothetical protein